MPSTTHTSSYGAGEDDAIARQVGRSLDKLNEVTDKIIRNYDEDRKQLEELIYSIRDRISSLEAEGEKVPRILWESLTKLIEIKTLAGSGAVKAIEANAKIISAIKQAVRAAEKQSDSETIDQELIEVLSQPVDEV